MRELVRGVRKAERDLRLFFAFNLLAFVAWGVLQLVLNLYLRELGQDEAVMGLFSAAQTLAMAATGAAIGALFARLGIWRTMTGGLALFVVAAFALALVSSTPLLLAMAVLSGVGVSSLFAGTMPAIVEWVAPDGRQFATTVAFALVGLSLTLGSLVGGFLPRLIDLEPLAEFRWTIGGGAALAACALIPLLRMEPGRRRPVPHAGRPATAESGADAGRARSDAAVFVGLSAVYAIGYGALLPFYNVYLASLGAGPQTIGAVYALSGFLQATLGLLAPVVARRTGSLWAVAALRLAPLPVVAALLAAPSVGLAAVAFVARGATFGPTIPTEATFVAEVVPARSRSAVFGWRFASWNLAWAGASAAAGAIIVRAGYGPVIGIFIAAMVVASALWLLYFVRHPRVRDGGIAGALPRRRPSVKGAEL
jgi:MFS family permease